MASFARFIREWLHRKEISSNDDKPKPKAKVEVEQVKAAKDLVRLMAPAHDGYLTADDVIMSANAVQTASERNPPAFLKILEQMQLQGFDWEHIFLALGQNADSCMSGQEFVDGIHRLIHCNDFQQLFMLQLLFGQVKKLLIQSHDVMRHEIQSAFADATRDLACVALQPKAPTSAIPRLPVPPLPSAPSSACSTPRRSNAEKQSWQSFNPFSSTFGSDMQYVVAAPAEAIPAVANEWEPLSEFKPLDSLESGVSRLLGNLNGDKGGRPVSVPTTGSMGITFTNAFRGFESFRGFRGAQSGPRPTTPRDDGIPNPPTCFSPKFENSTPSTKKAHRSSLSHSPKSLSPRLSVSFQDPPARIYPVPGRFVQAEPFHGRFTYAEHFSHDESSRV